MGTAPNGFQTPKTSWQAADVVTANDFERIEGNIQAIEEGQRTIDPAQFPSGNVGTLRQLLDWFANRIKAITGMTNWWDTPTKSLEQLNTDLSSHLAEKASKTVFGHVQVGDRLSVVNGVISADIMFVTGNYVGDGLASRSINIGFTPSAVLVYPVDGYLFTNAHGSFPDAKYYGGLAINGQPYTGSGFTILEVITNGFKVFYEYYDPPSGYGYEIGTNKNGKAFAYIAFK